MGTSGRGGRSLLASAAMIVAVGAAAAGCGGGNKSSTATAQQSSSKSQGSAARVKILMVTGPLTDPFFSAIKKGGDAAARDLNVDFQYLSPRDLSNLGPDMARVEDSALARKPDGVVVSNFVPEAQDPGIKRMVDSGIPVVAMNAGPGWEKQGILNYIGEDPSKVGFQAGKALAAAGARVGVCVDHVPGNPTLEARCNGFAQAMKQAGGSTSVLNIPAEQSSNPTAVKSAIQGALRANGKVDALFTLGSAVAQNALEAVAAAGKADKVRVGTTDLSKAVLEAVQQGKLAFAIDQQPYLQAYYGVLIAAQQVRLGLHPIGQVPTAPLMVTKDNVAAVIKSNAQGGIRGAA